MDTADSNPPEELAKAVDALESLKSSGFILPGVCGSLSVKAERPDLYGEPQRILWTAGPDGAGAGSRMRVYGLRLDGLRRLLTLEDPPPRQLDNELGRLRLRAGDPLPPWECLLQAAFPDDCVLHTCPPALLAVASSKQGSRRLKELFGDDLGVLAFTPPGFQAARQLKGLLDSSPQVRACFLEGYGLWASGPDIEACLGLVDEIENRARTYLLEREAWETRPLQPASPAGEVRTRLALLRKEVSRQLGSPVILNQDRGFPVEEIFQRLEGDAGFWVAPPTLYHAQTTGWAPLFMGELDPIQPAASREDEKLSPPQVILERELGACSAGLSTEQAFRAGSAFNSTALAWLRAGRLGGYQGLDILGMAGAGRASFPRDEGPDAGPFSGEIALVTGGASGIGKACVESLLKRGAAVASMDINPSVVQMFEGGDYLGLHCDLTDEGSILGAFEALVRRFGGLDMLVLNAGIFPAGIRIESLDLAHWQKVMRINLDSNLVVMREAHPLLQSSPRGGRVLVNASKNVLAPGAGAAAYSSAKAAVTQLARVAALEWGKDKIRVNMIHPDAVFDTGIWTEEVLQARAAHYGMSVQQYKTRNLLGVELNSHYIGELVAEMLGPLFEKITGAQIPVDGGSDRVI